MDDEDDTAVGDRGAVDDELSGPLVGSVVCSNSNVVSNVFSVVSFPEKKIGCFGCCLDSKFCCFFFRIGRGCDLHGSKRLVIIINDTRELFLDELIAFF